MANNSSFTSVANLPGPGGCGRFSNVLQDPVSDGGVVDVVYATFVETRLVVKEWIDGYKKNNKHPKRFDTILSQNARREGSRQSGKLVSLMEGMASTYNGNLKSLLAFSSQTFSAVGGRSGCFMGRLTETMIGGVHIPNPKKAFMGRVVEHHTGLRLCFASAHFAISKIAAALEDVNPVKHAKLAFAKTLRKMLRKACRCGVINPRTIIILQGDLNSRTVLEGPVAHDVLLEVIADKRLQRAIQHGLPLPSGCWQEVNPINNARSLPITYKYSACVGRTMDKPGGSLTLGNVMEAYKSSSLRLPDSIDPYRRVLISIGEEKLKDWGLIFKRESFKSFRFPSCPDRVIFWAPDELANRLSWSLPQGGYSVNHCQSGSDHRPVTLEAVLHVTPEVQDLNDFLVPKPALLALDDFLEMDQEIEEELPKSDLAILLESDGEESDDEA